MTSRIVESCPLTKLNGGLSRLHSADKDAVPWLTNYGSRHAYEKKETKKTGTKIIPPVIINVHVKEYNKLPKCSIANTSE